MKKQSTILFLMAIVFCVRIVSFAQQRDSLIQLYPTLGDTITRQENEFYKLFPEFPGFEHATIYIRDNKFLISRLTYITDNGEERDTTQIKPLNTLGNIRTYIHTINTEYEQKIEKISSSALVTITTADGQMLTGNITRIDNEGLVLLIPPENQVTEGYKAKTNLVTIEKNQIKNVLIPGETKTLPYMGWGALIGAGLGAIIGFASGDDTEGWLRFSAGEKALGAGIALGLLGVVTGLIVGISTSTDDETIEVKSDEDFNKLKIYFKDVYMANRSFINYNY